MGKERRISIRISESDFRKVQGMRHGRTITQFFVDLIHQAVEREREETNSFLELMRKIDASDLRIISEKIDMVLHLLKHTENDRYDKYLKRILYESVRVNIAIEEFARRRLTRSDFYQQFLGDIAKRLEQKQREERGE